MVLSLENDALLVRVDAETGAVVGVRDKRAGLDLLDAAVAGGRPPWRLEWEPGSAETEWATPAGLGAEFASASSPTALDLTWRCADGITVAARIELPRDAVDATFAVRVHNAGDRQVSLVEYPVLAGIGRIGPPDAVDHLLHPFATGFLVREPLAVFPPGGGVPPGAYPEGFSGCTAQVMAYYAEGVGGFYLATHDATGWVKWLDFGRTDEGDLRARFLHSAADARPGNGIELPYRVHVGALAEGSWYAAADRYRDWARTQPFCAAGPLHSRPDRARWLLEDVGFAVFGVTTAYERSAWLRFFHDIAGRPVFHVTGPNWQAGRFDYQGNANGGRDSVLPAAVLPSYRDTLAGQGDHFATFTFTTLFSDRADPEAAEAEAAYQVIPGRDTAGDNTLSRDRYAFPFTCPVPELQRRDAVYRDTAAVRDCGASGTYWDIGPNNVVMRCLAPDHGHGRGGGADLTDAFRDVMTDVRTACRDAAGGRYVPLGTEMVNEAFLPQLDFYQARAEASPCSRFEAHPFWEWIRAGAAEKVPLFAYLYHEYGPVRLDGWGQLAAEQGDLFFWIAARVFCWGGLYELNYEFTSLEVVDGQIDDVRESYAPYCVQRRNEVRDECVAFVREIALARTGFANRYVAYGEMLRPLEFHADPPRVGLSWLHYDAPPDAPEYEAGGTLSVSSVVHAAWRYRAESCGFLFVNLLEEPQDVVVTIDPSRYGLDGDLRLAESTNEGTVDRGAVTDPADVRITLPARRVVALELSAAATRQG